MQRKPLTRSVAVLAAVASLAWSTVALPGTGDDWKLEVLEDAVPRVNRGTSDDITPVAHLNVGGTSDFQLQRREGEQVLDGQVVDRTLDLAVMGSVDPYGLTIVDVTDPAAPQQLSFVACGDFHNDVVVWQNYAALSHDGLGGTCEQEPTLGGRSRGAGVWIFDITDPANPVLVRSLGDREGVPRGPHNLSVHPETGELLFSYQALGGTPYWGTFPLAEVGTARATTVPMRDIEPHAGDSCHDVGLGLGVADALGTERDLLFCAGVTATYIWDVTESRQEPASVSTIANPGVSIHHGARLAPDGKTLVLNDELAGMIAAAGCQGGAPTGALWFYDISVPQAPVLVNVASTTELDPDNLACTSHFYNFIPSSDEGDLKVVTGWYTSGMIVHDFSTPGQAREVAYHAPDGAVFWAAYAWHGKLFGSSYAGGEAGGLYIADLEGLEDLPPLKHDEGTSWARWTPQG